MILLVTNRRDLTSDYIVLELEKRGTKFARLNTEMLAHGSVWFEPDSSGRSWRFEIEGDGFSLGEVTGAYYRRPEAPEIPASIVDYSARLYCSQEWGEVLHAAMASLENRWLNKPSAIAEAENKPLQLCVARECGLKVPETIITNRIESARQFLRGGPCVMKTLRAAFFQRDNQSCVIFTNGLEFLDDGMEASFQASPMIVQREIRKHCDLRVIVVGERVFAAEIHSQEFIETKLDWRRGVGVGLRHVKHALPALIEKYCIDVTYRLGLRFSAIDLVLDVENEYWFLEANPNGQWAWLESEVGLPIAKAIVDELEARQFDV